MLIWQSGRKAAADDDEKSDFIDDDDATEVFAHVFHESFFVCFGFFPTFGPCFSTTVRNNNCNAWEIITKSVCKEK